MALVVRGRRRSSVAAALLIAATLTGCSIITNLLSTENALIHAGYTSVNISFNGNNGLSTVVVRAGPSSQVTPTNDQTEATAQQQGAARVVWGQLPYRFDELDVTITGSGTARFSHADLVQLFGTRPASLDAESISSAAVGTVKTVLIVGALIFLVVLALVGLIIVLIVRGRRRRRALGGPWTGMPPGMPGYGTGQAFGAPPGPGPFGYQAGYPGAGGTPGDTTAWAPPPAQPGPDPS